MLSTAKLATGQSRHYLEQAQGPITRARAASSGAEDYYPAGPEAPGVWVGADASALAPGGTVQPEPERVRERAVRTRGYGRDVGLGR
jgi:hypothetical protein